MPVAEPALADGSRRLAVRGDRPSLFSLPRQTLMSEPITGECSPTWKGTDKPSGATFIPGTSYRYDLDCPACKFGTLIKAEGKGSWGKAMRCIDCKALFTTEQLVAAGIKRL